MHHLKFNLIYIQVYKQEIACHFLSNIVFWFTLLKIEIRVHLIELMRIKHAD